MWAADTNQDSGDVGELKLEAVLLLTQENEAEFTTIGLLTFIYSLPMLSSNIPIFDKDYLLDQTSVRSSEHSAWLGLVLGLLSQLNHKTSPTIGCQKCKYLWSESSHPWYLIMSLFSHLWYVTKSLLIIHPLSPSPCPLSIIPQKPLLFLQLSSVVYWSLSPLLQ